MLKVVAGIALAFMVVGIKCGNAQSAEQLIGVWINSMRDTAGTVTWRRIEFHGDGSYIQTSGRGNNPGTLIKGKWSISNGKLYEKLEIMMPSYGFPSGTETTLTLSMPDAYTAIIADVRYIKAH
jgi:hypothetical protein